MKREIKVIWNNIFHRDRIAAGQAEITGFKYEQGRGIEFYAKHPVFAAMAQELTLMFIEIGASNNLKVDMFDPASMKAYTLTVQEWGRHSHATMMVAYQDFIRQMAAGEPFTAADAQAVLDKFKRPEAK